jgi:superfamily II DNA/RNA helicase
VRQLAATMLREGRTRQVFIGTSADAELEANTAVTQVFVHATDDEKEAKLYKFLCGLAEGSRVMCAGPRRQPPDSSGVGGA